jgi:hypothetical protein
MQPPAVQAERQNARQKFLQRLTGFSACAFTVCQTRLAASTQCCNEFCPSSVTPCPGVHIAEQEATLARLPSTATAADQQTSADSGPDPRQDDEAFVWPPSEADLDAILVWDTKEWREVRLDTNVAPVPSNQLPIESPGRATDTRSSDGLAPETLEHAPLDLVVQEAGRPPAPAPNWNSRSLRAAAIAVCGLTAVTWWEVKIPQTRPAQADTVQLKTSPAPIVSRYPGGTMPLVAAEGVRPHAFTHVIGQQRPTASATRDVGRPLVSAATATAGLARIEKAARVPSSPLTIAGNADIRRGRITDIFRMALPTPAVDSLPVPPTPPADAATAALARSDAAETVPAASSKARDEERNIYQVVQQYERAYEQLDVDAARAIWPSVDARALARAFDGLKEQQLEFSSCRVTVAAGEATVVCGGRASYVTRVGHHATRTEPREWTFRLRKIDANWLIAKAEVQ